jgi:chromosomal replication initiation ATPase DnaA
LESFRKLKIHIKGDERILGDSDFVAAVLEEQNERLERYYRLRAKGFDFDKVVKRAAAIFELKPEEILSAGKQRLRVRARSVLVLLGCQRVGHERDLSCQAVKYRPARGKPGGRQGGEFGR